MLTSLQECSNSSTKLIFDPYFLKPPLCVLCIKSDSQLPIYADNAKTLSVGPILDFRWLYWIDERNAAHSNPPPTTWVHIGDADQRQFYARSYADFAEFVLTTLPLPPSPLT